ncbi:cyclic peptide export ABC transporter [Neisseriaceae bacterium TC5R-5]|nr:cyclic peptide export ABC transporter [Neisseriaceae bacterium TC5R-5]
MNLLKYLYSQSWPLFLLSVFSGLVSGFSGAALVGIISKEIEKPNESSVFVWLFFGLCLLFFISKAIASISLLHLTQSAILSLRIKLSNRLLLTPLKQLNKLGNHGLLAILTKDVDTFSQSFILAPIVFGNTILILACLAYLAWVSWSLFLILAACFLIGMYIIDLLQKTPFRLLEEGREKIDRLYLHFKNLIDGNKELQLNAGRGQAYIQQVLRPGAQDLKKTFIDALTGFSWVISSAALMFYLIIGLMIFVVPIWIPVEPKTLIAVALIVLFLVGPILEIMGALPQLREAGISLQKMRQLDVDLQNNQATPAVSINPFLSENNSSISLELKNIIHHYSNDFDDSYFVLGPFNLSMRQGEVVFIIGGNGSGKTTLAMLLLGLFQADSGTICLNGVQMNATNNEHYRQFFAVVFSDFHLFEQLLSADPDAIAKANHYIKALKMDKKVKVVDGKFSTINLSTGQRKRLALVSAYLEDRPIYLFDEWAADQDPVFKKVFYTELLPELKARGKTVIVISHDDAYFKFADRVVKLEDGKIKDLQVSREQVSEHVAF